MDPCSGEYKMLSLTESTEVEEKLFWRIGISRFSKNNTLSEVSVISNE